MPPAGAFFPLRIDIRRKLYRSRAGEVEALRDLSFELRPGETLCVMGPSGAGKTTALRILLGLDRDFEGSVEPDPATIRSAAVFQEPRLLPWRNVETNVRLALPRAERDRDLDELFASLGLAPSRKRYPGELSGGMARRVALARALAVGPDLLVLDEPFVSLDDQSAAELRQVVFREARRRASAVLLVTHDLVEAVQAADRLLLLGPRPARVLAEIAITQPETERSRAWSERMRAELAERYPEVVAR
jgi:NitT/TauT family transport system ATP-binding protein